MHYIYFSDLANIYMWGNTNSARIQYTESVIESSGTTACCQGYSAVRSGYLSIGCSNTTMQFTFIGKPYWLAKHYMLWKSQQYIC